MGFVSIKNQIVRIVQNLAYKAYGFEINYPWFKAEQIINKQQQKIGYKIPIPHLIYHKYSEDGFIYSDPGTTPRQIAQDILVHFKSLNGLQMQSDEFGNIVCYVKEQYFERRCQQFFRLNKIGCLQFMEVGYHHNQTVKLREQINYVKDIVMVLFRNYSNKISLSELRQQLVFKSISNIQKSVFDRNTEIINITGSSSNNLKSFTLSGDENKNVLNNFSLNSHQLLYGCERHQVIQKQAILQNILDLNLNKLQEQQNQHVHMFKFGIVVPENLNIKTIHLQSKNHNNKLLKETHYTNILPQQQMNKFKTICYDTPLHKPINLPLITQLNSQYKTKINKNHLTLPLTCQQLLLKIDQLTSQHKISQLYHLYLLLDTLLINLPKNNLENSKKKKQYLDISKITRDHLHQVFFL